MGYHYIPPEPPEEERGGCREVFVLTRAVFAVLLVPVGILIGAVTVLALLIYLFGRSTLLGLAGLALIVLAIAAYARWEQDHFRGPRDL